MPQERKYKVGSVIYFEGDKGDEIYILKEGKVNLVFTPIGETAEENEHIKVGEFFGVRSALTKNKREETAHVLVDSTVLSVSSEEFESFAAKNVPTVIKILRTMSNQIRELGKKARSFLSSDAEFSPENGLFSVGEYFLKEKDFEKAKYTFSKFIQLYPESKILTKAKISLSNAVAGRTGITTSEIPVNKTEEKETEKPKETSVSVASFEESQVSLINKDDIQSGSEESTQSLKLNPDISKLYFEGISLFSEGKYEESFQIISTLKEKEEYQNNLEFAEKIDFEYGKCLISMEKYKNALEAFSNFLKKYPKTVNLKNAIFNIGKCYIALGENDKAASFLKKVVNTPPNEAINIKAKKALEKIENQ